MKQLSIITSRQNDIIKKTALLKKSPSPDMFFLEGAKFVLDTPVSRIKYLFVTDLEKYSEFSARCLKADVTVYQITAPVMAKICDAVSEQGLAAVVCTPEHEMPNKLILLDGVRDSGNAGTIARSAAAFGFGCIFSPDSANPFAGKTVRSSAGAVMDCYIKRTELKKAIDRLKSSGYQILSSELDKSARPMQEFSSPEKLAVVVGNEGQGVSAEISALADEKIYIPIYKTQSLNVGVAAGILMCYFAG